MGEDKPILVVGLVCLDIVTHVETFPIEDSDQRATECRWQRGGNASNTCSVISQLGGQCELLAALGGSHEISFLEKDLDKYNIPYHHCMRYVDRDCPNSVVIVNDQTASRTIVHYNRNLPECKLDDFKNTVELNKYRWIHFEGRRNNRDEIVSMLQYVSEHNSHVSTENIVTTSVELEKPALVNLDCLALHADYVFMSKDYARIRHGFNDMEDAVQSFIQRCRSGASVICPWGDKGAAAKTGSQPLVSTEAFPPHKLIDTLGAGDTFNGATILALSKGADILKAIKFGCKVAGAKCGMTGFGGLGDLTISVS